MTKQDAKSISIALALCLMVIGWAQPAISDESGNQITALTTPSLGSRHTVSKNAAIAEGFSAEIVEHNDAVRLQEDKTLRFDSRNEFTLAAGTVLLADKGRWFCTYGPPRRVAKRFNIHICMRDRDRDGLFDQSRIQGSTRASLMRPKLPYEELESWIEYVPAGGTKRILVFAGYESGAILLKDIVFAESPNDPLSVSDLSIPSPDTAGEIEVDGVTFMVLSVNANSISFIRTGGELRPPPPQE